jgi:hypothetical protein
MGFRKHIDTHEHVREAIGRRWQSWVAGRCWERMAGEVTACLGPVRSLPDASFALANDELGLLSCRSPALPAQEPQNFGISPTRRPDFLSQSTQRCPRISERTFWQWPP